MIDKSIPLNELLTGQWAHVSRIAGEPDDVHRLQEFGLRGGTRIQMFRRGNPCIFRMMVCSASWWSRTPRRASWPVLCRSLPNPAR